MTGKRYISKSGAVVTVVKASNAMVTFKNEYGFTSKMSFQKFKLNYTKVDK